MKIILQCGNPDRLLYVSPTTFYFPERYLLHPKLHIEFVETLLRDIHVNNTYHKDMFKDNVIFIMTNSDYIINRCRVAKKEGEIDELEVQFESITDDILYSIYTDKNGSFSEYPDGFLEEYEDLLVKLL